MELIEIRKAYSSVEVSGRLPRSQIRTSTYFAPRYKKDTPILSRAPQAKQDSSKYRSWLLTPIWVDISSLIDV